MTAGRRLAGEGSAPPRLGAAHSGAARPGVARPGTARPGAPRSLGAPTPVPVRSGAGGRPEVVGGRRVESVRESWLVEDRWWTASPVRRRYWEVVTADGRNLVVFRELAKGRWFEQRG